jgi:hypothetical protein
MIDPLVNFDMTGFRLAAAAAMTLQLAMHCKTSLFFYCILLSYASDVECTMLPHINKYRLSSIFRFEPIEESGGSWKLRNKST